MSTNAAKALDQDHAELETLFWLFISISTYEINVFGTKNTWVFSVSRFVSTACTRFLIITLLFGFLIPKFSFNLFLIIAFLYEIYLWIFSRGVRHEWLALWAFHAVLQSLVLFSNVRSLPTLTSFSPMFVFCISVTRRSRKIVFALDKCILSPIACGL